MQVDNNVSFKGITLVKYAKLSRRQPHSHLVKLGRLHMNLRKNLLWTTASSSTPVKLDDINEILLSEQDVLNLAKTELGVDIPEKFIKGKTAEVRKLLRKNPEMAQTAGQAINRVRQGAFGWAAFLGHSCSYVEKMLKTGKDASGKAIKTVYA